MNFLIVASTLLVLAGHSIGQKYRDDLRCGSTDYPAPDGSGAAECDPFGVYPCCSPYNWCGITADHCDCADCDDYRVDWREDLRCGGDYLAATGEVVECDPFGVYPCCSPYNWCGITADHCDCTNCDDYRVDWREDLRCGGDYLAATGEVAECDPEGLYPCCSPYNWCGNTADHCDCAECVDYKE